MGDIFKDINQSVIATHGSISQGIITLQQKGQEETAKALLDLHTLIMEASDEILPPEKKAETMDLLNGLTEETNKPQPSNSVLRSLGNSLSSILTSVEPLAAAASKAFDVLKLLWP